MSSPAAADSSALTHGLSLVTHAALSANTSGGAERCDDACAFERVVSTVVPVVFGLVALAGSVGNTFVTVIVAANPRMRSTTNLLILNLALSDLLFLVFCVPFTASRYALRSWPFGSLLCCFVEYLINVSLFASVYTLVLMSLDRYLAVVHAVQALTLRTKRNTLVAILLLWLVILLANAPMLFQHIVYEYTFEGDTRSICLNDWKMDVQNSNFKMHYNLIYHLLLFAFGILLPLGLICVLYGIMLYKLKRTGVSGRPSVTSRRKKVTFLVISVVVIFAVCWLPIQILILMENFLPSEVLNTIPYRGTQMALNCLAYLNSCVNPFLYAFLSQNFRSGFVNLLQGKCPVLLRSRESFRSNANHTYKAGRKRLEEYTHMEQAPGPSETVCDQMLASSV